MNEQNTSQWLARLGGILWRLVLPVLWLPLWVVAGWAVVDKFSPDATPVRSWTDLWEFLFNTLQVLGALIYMSIAVGLVLLINAVGSMWPAYWGWPARRWVLPVVGVGLVVLVLNFFAIWSDWPRTATYWTLGTAIALALPGAIEWLLGRCRPAARLKR